MKALEQPVLIANRYRLRPFEWRDAALIQEASKDPLIPLISTVPSCGSHTAAVEFIERQHHRLVERSGYSFAIVDSTTGQASGQIGLWLKNANDGRASIGYWIGPNHRKRGAATAALAALSEWGLTRPGIHRLELYVEPWNEGSWRTAERCGYAREGLMRSWQEVGGLRKDMYMYARTSSPVAPSNRHSHNPPNV